VLAQAADICCRLNDTGDSIHLAHKPDESASDARATAPLVSFGSAVSPSEATSGALVELAANL